MKMIIKGEENDSNFGNDDNVDNESHLLINAFLLKKTKTKQNNPSPQKKNHQKNQKHNKKNKQTTTTTHTTKKRISEDTF